MADHRSAAIAIKLELKMIQKVTLGASLKVSLSALALSTMAVLAHAAPAPVVVNGSFEDTTLTGAGQMTSSNVTGWTTTSGWTFLTNGIQNPTRNLGTTEFAAAVFRSPDGGRFLASDGAFLNGVESTVLSGLTAGADYTISFYQALTQQSGVRNTSDFFGHWDINIGGSVNPLATFAPSSADLTVGPLFIGGTTVSAAGMTAAHNGRTDWVQQFVTFTASKDTESLNFYASGGPNGLPPFLLLDGVSITGGNVPEPSTMALVALSLAGLAGLRRRKASTAA